MERMTAAIIRTGINVDKNVEAEGEASRELPVLAAMIAVS